MAGSAIPGQNRFMSICLGEFNFRLGVTGETHDIQSFLQERRQIGSVGVVAGIALFIRERLMDGLSIQGFPGFFMTVVA